jgi:hypothetical protein
MAKPSGKCVSRVSRKSCDRFTRRLVLGRPRLERPDLLGVGRRKCDELAAAGRRTGCVSGDPGGLGHRRFRASAPALVPPGDDERTSQSPSEDDVGGTAVASAACPNPGRANKLALCCFRSVDGDLDPAILLPTGGRFVACDGRTIAHS